MENRGATCANTTRVHQPEASLQVCGTETCRGRLRLLPEERASHPSSSIPAIANARSYSVSRLRGPTSEAGVISTRRSARPHGLNKTANVHSQWATNKPPDGRETGSTQGCVPRTEARSLEVWSSSGN